MSEAEKKADRIKMEQRIQKNYEMVALKKQRFVKMLSTEKQEQFELAKSKAIWLAEHVRADILMETGGDMVGRILLTKDCFLLSSGCSKEVRIVLTALILSVNDVTLSPHNDTVMIEFCFNLYDEVER